MNRIDICKNIIQSIKEYITNPAKLEPHRAQNHFIRNRKLSLLQVIMYLLYSSKASFHHYLASERAAAIEHLRSLETLNIYENSVVIFDRGYYSEKLFRYCVEHGHTCLMRLKENYKISKNTSY